jgi:hypothetical protein
MKGWTGATLGKIKYENITEQKKINIHLSNGNIRDYTEKWLLLLNGLDKDRPEKIFFFTNGRGIENDASFKT